MHPSLEIGTKLQGYLDRSVSLQELREWFRGAAGTLFDSPAESTAVELAAALQLALIEHDRGDFSERQVKRYLKQALIDALAPQTTTAH